MNLSSKLKTEDTKAAASWFSVLDELQTLEKGQDREPVPTGLLPPLIQTPPPSPTRAELQYPEDS